MRNEYRVTWKLYQSWLVENMLRLPKLIFIIIWCLFGGYCIWMGVDGFLSVFYYLLAFYCFYKAIVREFLFARKQYNALAKMYGQNEWMRTTTFRDGEILLEDGSSSYRISYSDITCVREKDDKVWIELSSKMVLRIYKSAFVEGDWESCKQFIETRQNVK